MRKKYSYLRGDKVIFKIYPKISLILSGVVQVTQNRFGNITVLRPDSSTCYARPELDITKYSLTELLAELDRVKQ